MYADNRLSTSDPPVLYQISGKTLKSPNIHTLTLTLNGNIDMKYTDQIADLIGEKVGFDSKWLHRGSSSINPNNT